ncbi:hypothetical protein G9A89_011973 [Geosiphon pyriformis]|nr:hypothetical protein G9A89_011973 [Geosiphon pyriformis]
MGLCCSCLRRVNRIEYQRPQYRVVDGRRYHNLENSEYRLANDEPEVDRLERYHHCQKQIWEGNFKSPVDEILRKGASVLEIGCGPGTWTLDMAKTYPNSHFVAIDISPVFPTTNIPENVEFLQYNLLDGLPMEKSTFDFIHQRYLVGGFTQEQWRNNVIQELLRVTRPGGWIEFIETDAEWPSEGDVTQRIGKSLVDMMRSIGLNPNIGQELPAIFESTNGFSEIKKKAITIRLGEKGGKIGQESLRFVVNGLRSGAPFLRDYMNISAEHYNAFVEVMEIEANQSVTLLNQYRVFGRKKLEPIF